MPHEFHDDTLGDIESRDIDNLQYVLKHSTDKYFDSIQHALAFSQHALHESLKKFGVSEDILFGDPDKVEGELERMGLKVESRFYDGEEDSYRSGLYLYKVSKDGDSEIVVFIGKPQSGYLSGSIMVKTTFKE